MYTVACPEVHSEFGLKANVCVQQKNTLVLKGKIKYNEFKKKERDKYLLKQLPTT